MDGEPLPVEHGFPVRMVVPGLYGYVSATKWVTELRVTRFADATAYWTDRGWSPRGTDQDAVAHRGAEARARRCRPGRSSSPGPPGRSTAASPGCRCASTTGGWSDATLADDGGIDSWRQWSWTWDAEPGEYQLFVRASDPQGPQTGAVADVVPDGATGYDTVRVTVT